MPTTTLKTHDLTGPALNWAMAIAEGIPPERLTFWSSTKAVVRRLDNGLGQRLDFDTNANQMHEIIERERINIVTDADTGEWFAGIHGRYGVMSRTGSPTGLIAAARCRVAHKLGPTVQVPCELVEG